MKKILLICMLLMVYFVSSCFAGLDDSGEKKVTIKTEIIRGSEVAWESIKFLPKTTKMIDYILDSNHLNQQRNTDTDGYYLGVYYQAWIFTSGLSDYGDKQYIDDMSKIYFKKFREKQKQLEISDDDLINVVGYDVKNANELKNKISQWDQQPPN